MRSGLFSNRAPTARVGRRLLEYSISSADSASTQHTEQRQLSDHYALYPGLEAAVTGPTVVAV